MSELVCTHCGKDEGFSENVTVEGWREVDVELRDDGKIGVTQGWQSDVDWASADVMSYQCDACGESALSIEDLAKPSDAVDEPQPGEVVWDPDGIRAVVQRVDGDDVYVVGFPVPYPRSGLRRPKPPLPDRLIDLEAA